MAGGIIYDAIIMYAVLTGVKLDGETNSKRQMYL